MSFWKNWFASLRKDSLDKPVSHHGTVVAANDHAEYLYRRDIVKGMLFDTWNLFFGRHNEGYLMKYDSFFSARQQQKLFMDRTHYLFTKKCKWFKFFYREYSEGHMALVHGAPSVKGIEWGVKYTDDASFVEHVALEAALKDDQYTVWEITGDNDTKHGCERGIEDAVETVELHARGKTAFHKTPDALVFFTTEDGRGLAIEYGCVDIKKDIVAQLRKKFDIYDTGDTGPWLP